jgi:YesN/AraC family two-component response regulator
MVIYEEFRSYLNYETFERDDENITFDLHLHNSFEIFYVMDGEVIVTIEGCDYSVLKGQAIMILPNRIHSYKTPVKSKSRVHIFSNNYISSFYHKVKDKTPKNPVFDLDFSVLEELHTKGADKYLLKSIYYRIAHIFNKSTYFVERKSKSADNYVRILTYISEHYQEPITAIDVARELGYDHRYVTSLIKKGLKSTFRTLLNEYRISHAQHALTTENKSISQIAYECGYESLCSFNRNFKEITGTTPKEFRQDRN